MLMTKCAKVRKLLQTPSTVSEVAAILKLDMRSAQLGIWMLTSTGQAESCGQAPNPSDRWNARKTLKLYRLTKHGYYMLHRDQRKKQK